VNYTVRPIENNFNIDISRNCAHFRKIYNIYFFRDGKSEDEDEDEDYDGCNGDSGDFPSLENSGKTSPSSGEYYRMAHEMIQRLIQY
jgi:hypothetical protein